MEDIVSPAHYHERGNACVKETANVFTGYMFVCVYMYLRQVGAIRLGHKYEDPRT